MNTFRIYEEFRESLGEAAAKALAQTLGSMLEEMKDSVTKEDLRILSESMKDSGDRNVSRLESAIANLAEAQGRTEVCVLELANAQQRTAARLDELAAAQQRTEARLDELAVAQQRTEARLEELAGAMRSLAAVVEKLVIRTDRHEGTLLEMKFRNRLPAYLGLFLRKGRVVCATDLLDEIEPCHTQSEVEDFLRADVVAKGTVAGQPTYLVVEVSYTADADDVTRAARRAACLSKAGLPAIALVACEVMPPQTAAFAREQAVRIWVNGRMVDMPA